MNCLVLDRAAVSHDDSDPAWQPTWQPARYVLWQYDVGKCGSGSERGCALATARKYEDPQPHLSTRVDTHTMCAIHETDGDSRLDASTACQLGLLAYQLIYATGQQS